MKKWQKILKRRLVKTMRAKVKTTGTKKRFYLDSIQFIKRKRGFILPQETTYHKLADLLENYADSRTTGTDYQRCLLAASKLGIGLPRPFIVKNDRIIKVTMPAHERREKFYSSFQWKKLRYATFVRYGAICQCCGASGKEAKMRVDHIKPVSRYWHLRLDPENVQPFCNDCNWGKLNLDETDWRKPLAPKRARLRLVAS